MMNKNQEYYTSRDLTIVAYLVASGFTLASYRIAGGGLMLFTFPNSEELQQHISNFYCLTAMINPTVYYNTLRSLKSLLHGNRHNHEYEYVEQFNRAK